MAFYSLTLRSCGRGLWRPILKRDSDFGDGELKTYIHIPSSWGFHRYIKIRGAKQQSKDLYVVEQTNGNRKHSIQLIVKIGNSSNKFYYDLE